MVLVSDGGGKKRAALRPLHGAEKIARWLMGVLSEEEASAFEVRLAKLNGEDAFIAYNGDEVDSVGFTEIDASGRISQIYVVRNPDKLTAIPRLPDLPQY